MTPVSKKSSVEKSELEKLVVLDCKTNYMQGMPFEGKSIWSEMVDSVTKSHYASHLKNDEMLKAAIYKGDITRKSGFLSGLP